MLQVVIDARATHAAVLCASHVASAVMGVGSDESPLVVTPDWKVPLSSLAGRRIQEGIVKMQGSRSRTLRTLSSTLESDIRPCMLT